MPEGLLTLSSVERLTKVTRLTLRRRCEKGIISAKNDSGRMLIPVSEVLRLWPNVSGEAIEKELTGYHAKNDNQTSEQQVITIQSDNRENELTRIIEQQKQMINNQNEIIQLLKAQIGQLTDDKAMLVRQIEQLRDDYRMFTRLLPQSTTVKTQKRPQARDENGRFIPKGAASLFEGNS